MSCRLPNPKRRRRRGAVLPRAGPLRAHPARFLRPPVQHAQSRSGDLPMSQRRPAGHLVRLCRGARQGTEHTGQPSQDRQRVLGTGVGILGRSRPQRPRTRASLRRHAGVPLQRHVGGRHLGSAEDDPAHLRRQALSVPPHSSASPPANRNAGTANSDTMIRHVVLRTVSRVSTSQSAEWRPCFVALLAADFRQPR